MPVIQAAGYDVDVNARAVIDLRDGTLVAATDRVAEFTEPTATFDDTNATESPYVVLRGTLSYSNGTLDPSSQINEVDIGSAQQGALLYITGLSLTGAQLLALAPGQGPSGALLFGGGATYDALGEFSSIRFVGGQNGAYFGARTQTVSVTGAGDGDKVFASWGRYGSSFSGTPGGGETLTTTAQGASAPLTASLSGVGAVQFMDGVIYDGATTVGGQVDRLYHATLGRAGDPVGLGYWTNRLDTGQGSLLDVAAGFITSPEFQATYGALDDNGFVNRLYQNVLGRAGEASGVSYWDQLLGSGTLTRAGVVLGFSQSPEYVQDSAADLRNGLWAPDPAAIEALGFYDAALGRLPDAAGLAGWINTIHNGASQATVAQSFYNSTEFQTGYASLGTADFVNLLYHNTLGRPGDAQGVQTWTNALNSGALSRAAVLAGFATSQELVADLAPDYVAGIKTVG